jgi:hypothetical protein
LVPRVIADAGDKAARRFLEFFAATIRRSAAGRSGTLTEKPMNRVDAWRMIQRRAADLGARVRIGCHRKAWMLWSMPLGQPKQQTRKAALRVGQGDRRPRPTFAR